MFTVRVHTPAVSDSITSSGGSATVCVGPGPVAVSVPRQLAGSWGRLKVTGRSTLVVAVGPVDRPLSPPHAWMRASPSSHATRYRRHSVTRARMDRTSLLEPVGQPYVHVHAVDRAGLGKE